MPQQLLLGPEAREQVGCRLTEECLHWLDFEECDVLHQQCKGHLEGNILRRRSTWRLRYPGAKVCGAFWQGHGGKIVREQIA